MTRNWPLTTNNLPDGSLELEAAYLARHWYEGTRHPLYALASTGHIASNREELRNMRDACREVLFFANDADDREAFTALRDWCTAQLVSDRDEQEANQ